MSAVQPSRHELQRQLDFPWLTDTLVTLQVTGSSVKSWVKVEMAGSSTKGTRNRNANTLTIHRVPVMKNVFYVLGCKVVLHTQLYLVFKVASLAVFGKSTSFTAKLCGRCNAQNDAVFSRAGFPNLGGHFQICDSGWGIMYFVLT